MTKIVIAGAAGRMGKTLIRCSQNMESIQLVGGIEFSEHPDLNKDLGTLAEIDTLGIPLTSDLESILPEADVLVDFTLHTAVPVNVRTAHKLRRAVVIGATALSDEETAPLLKASHDIPIVWAPNMSLGVNLLFATARKAAAVLGLDYTIEIDETHHVHKIDSPSGTALRLGEKAAEGRGVELKDVMIHDEGGHLDKTEPGKIVVHSHREGEVVGIHTVRFENSGETIELTHNAHSRDAFALGALKAAEWVAKQRPRLYDMQDVLGLNF